MQTKVQAYVQLADETSLKITGNYLDWLSFLTTASRLYKYPYHDQLMIYAQRPDASACAAYELWNGTMHRYIRRGAKGIALLNPTANGMRIRYVFDVSDTGTRADSRNVDVWQLTEAAEPAVRKMLQKNFLRMRRRALPRRSTSLPSVKRLPIGTNTAATSSTVLTIRHYRSTMILRRGRPSEKQRRQASRLSSRPDADWSRSCCGRIFKRSWTGTRPQPRRNWARQSARLPSRCSAR